MSSLTTIPTPRKDLDVLSKYRELLAESLGADSVYIRTKETYEALAASGDLKDADKAKVLAETLSSMNGSLANSCMQAALEWVKAEKDFEFKKLETARQLKVLDKDAELRAAQIAKVKSEDIATQAETIRVMGKPDVVEGKVIGLAAEGKIFGDMSLTTAQAGKVTAETTLTGSKLKESHAAIHKLVADTITNYGVWNNYTVTEHGISTDVGEVPAMLRIENVKPLSDMQRTIAEEQARGYTYNAWANAVTASAGMMGTLIASDAGGSDDAGIALDKFNNVLDLLITVNPPYNNNDKPAAGKGYGANAGA